MFEATPEKVFDSVEILERIAGGILKGIVSEAIPEVSLDELLKKILRNFGVSTRIFQEISGQILRNNSRRIFKENL